MRAAIVTGILGVPVLATMYWRRTRPLLPSLALAAYFVITGGLAPDYFNQLTSPFVALMITLFSLGRYAQHRQAAIGAVTLIAAARSPRRLVEDFYSNPVQLLWLLVLGLGPFFAGRTMGRRTQLQGQLLERTGELERDRELVAERAVGDERARIAGELQAVVANGVSVMVLQAEGIPRVLASGEVARAEHALALIEETGRDSLAEMRRLLGVLRRDDEGPSLAPLPTLSAVEQLQTQIRADGLVVAIEFDGERHQLPPGADLAAYRVLEEALDAAGKAGARSAEVTIAFAPEELRIDVRDDRPDPGVDPEPLLAMRERLGLYGGRVRAGSAEDGSGFEVVARLPLSEVAA